MSLEILQEAPDANVVEPGLEFQALHEIIKAAHAKLDRNTWDYLVGGSETETTIRRNRQGLDSIAFRPRVLRNVAEIDTSARFFDQRTTMPVLIAPVGSLPSFHADGGKAVAGAAARFGVPVFVSSSTEGMMLAVANAAPPAKVFQLYMRGSQEWADAQIERAREAGYSTLCITVDNAVASRRERDIAKRFVKTWGRKGRAVDESAAFTWSDLQRIKDLFGMRMIVKGIATAEDAEMACELGIDAVYISNHGGRQLDHGRGAIEVLPEVVAAVAGRAAVFVDGGFSRGTDIVKAICLGANAVGIGRLYLYGLAAAGADGVFRVLELLHSEIRSCLGLLGVSRLEDLNPSYLHPAQPVSAPHVHSAFPLLHLPEQRY